MRKLSWSRTDLLLGVGLLLVAFGCWKKEWEAFTGGVALLILGGLLPRMKGPFSLGGPKMNFQGELSDPAERPNQPQLPAAQPARLLPADPPAESRPPLEK